MSGVIPTLPLYGFEWRTDSFTFAVTECVCRSALPHDTVALGG